MKKFFKIYLAKPVAICILVDKQRRFNSHSVSKRFFLFSVTNPILLNKFSGTMAFRIDTGTSFINLGRITPSVLFQKKGIGL
jgi:hypothetical protein